MGKCFTALLSKIPLYNTVYSNTGVRVLQEYKARCCKGVYSVGGIFYSLKDQCCTESMHTHHPDSC